ncbi:MAG: heparinase II/III domain-containing protein [Thermogutta sp.]
MKVPLVQPRWIILAALCILAPYRATRADDVLATLRKEHPRLIVLPEDETRVKKLLANDEKAQAIFRSVQREAEQILGQPPIQHRLIGPRLLDQSRRCLSRVYMSATVYRLTGDKKFADRAIQEMLTAANFPDWNPSHFLDTAEMTHALAIGYDWLYPVMSHQQREVIRKAIVEKGLKEGQKVYEKGTWWTKTAWNWNQVCNGGMTIGALAIADEEPELSRFIVEQAIQSIPRALANYAPDGAWAEGPGYWSYATHYTVYMLAALESALGTDFALSQQPGFDRAGDFRIHVIGPSGLAFNFADGGARVGGAPIMLWLARKFQRPLYAWHELETIGEKSPLHLWWYFQPVARIEDEPTARWFRNADVVTMRTDWTNQAVFVGLKGGDNAVNHSHLELGSFVMDALGRRWVLDLGSDDYNLPGYFGSQRWTYYRLATEGQNTLLFDGQNQNPRAKAPVIAFYSSDQRRHAVVDLTAAYTGGKNASQAGRNDSVQRGIAILGKDWVLIQDEIKGHEGQNVQWQIHTEAKVEVRGKEADLKLRDQTIKAILLCPADAVFQTMSANPPPPQRQNPGVTRLVVRTQVAKEGTNIAVAFQLSSKPRAEIPKVIPLKDWPTQAP